MLTYFRGVWKRFQSLLLPRETSLPTSKGITSEREAQEREEQGGQVEAIQRQLAETQKQLEATQRQLAELQWQREEARKQLEVTQRQLAELQMSFDVQRQDGTASDDPLANKRWLKLVEECVRLFDYLEEKANSFDPERREVVLFVCSQLEESLERAGVEVIVDDQTFDEHRHQVEKAMKRIVPGTPIVETVSAGFAVGPRVLRRACVRLGSSCGE